MLYTKEQLQAAFNEGYAEGYENGKKDANDTVSDLQKSKDNEVSWEFSKANSYEAEWAK